MADNADENERGRRNMDGKISGRGFKRLAVIHNLECFQPPGNLCANRGRDPSGFRLAMPALGFMNA